MVNYLTNQPEVEKSPEFFILFQNKLDTEFLTEECVKKCCSTFRFRRIQVRLDPIAIWLVTMKRRRMVLCIELHTHFKAARQITLFFFLSSDVLIFKQS